MNAADVAEYIDDLYRRAVDNPEQVDDPLLMEWAEAAAGTQGNDRGRAKAIRKAIRTARKLAKYWAEHDSSGLPSWRNGVDEALGSLGWQAQLTVLRSALEAAPDPEMFEMVKQRHRAVHFSEWMEGVTYEEWVSSR